MLENIFKSLCRVAVVTKVLKMLKIKDEAGSGGMGRGNGAVVLTTSTLRVQEAKHMVVAGSLGFIYIYKHLPFTPAFSVLISPAISPFSAVNTFQQTQVSEGEGKKS